MSADAEQLQRRNRELTILNTLAEALNRESDLRRALHATLAQVADAFALRTGWIWLLDVHSGAPYLAATLHLPPALAAAPARMDGSCYCLDTYQAGDLNGAANINVITCSRLKGLIDGTEGLRYHASVPLYAHGKQVGVLNVASAEWRELSPDDLRLLYTVGDLLGIAIARARLFAASAQLGALEERNRLAREIHDTLAQGLTAITLQLEAADALLEVAQPQRAHPAVRRALGLARASLDAARRSVLDLRAAPLDGQRLAEALPRLAHGLVEPGQLDIAVAITGAAYPLPPSVAVGLYRIAQEAITNVVRHAHAQHLALRLHVTPDQAALVVADDGRGFDPAQVPPGHFGLIGMRERAHLLGGALHLRSTAGGTHLEATVPLDAAQ